MAKTYKAPSPEFIPAKWFGPKQSTFKWLVVHETQSPSQPGQAVATARYFQRGDVKSSAHYVVDPEKIVQSVYDHDVAWHCGHNKGSIGVEFCGFSKPANTKDRKRWFLADGKTFTPQAHRGAKLIAELCLAYNIRPYFVGTLGLKAGVKGVTTHSHMTDAFHQSVHWDPGAWPRTRFMRLVRKYYRELK